MRKLISSLLAMLVVSNLHAEHTAPKLVVCITIDQLRGDYIEYFYHTFGENGFKRLMNEGAVYHNLQFEFPNVDQATAFATLFTGTNPCQHGITANLVYDFSKLKEVSPLHDPNYLGNFTRDNYSPKNLLASTIGDELRIASGGSSQVYAVAPDAESALLSGGQAANGAFWIDNSNGKWATTTYFKDIPWYVEKYNNSTESLPVRMDAMTWQPTLPLEAYKALPYVHDKVAFNHTFKSKTADCFLKIKTSPFGNKEVNRLFFQFLEYGGIGTRPFPDLFALTYYAGNYHNNKAKDYSFEIQDAYLQLDKEIELLLNTIDKKVGLKNTLVVLTGTGYFKSETSPPPPACNWQVASFTPNAASRCSTCT